MAIHSDKNLYPGINVHLNSHLQNEPGGWESFHSAHVIDIARTLDAVLPPGYFTRPEKSLQISEIALTAHRTSATKPDVSVYQRRSEIAGTAPAAPTATPPTATLPLAETLAAEEHLTGVVVYQTAQDDPLGRPVTRLELLSPANKPGGSHHSQYAAKRLQTLQSGLRLVEIDYLHRTRPIIATLPSYPDREDGAFSYSVLVHDPRPSLREGQTQIYGFGVDDRLPIVSVPLAGEDAVAFDLGATYQRTFGESKFFALVVDYEQEPEVLEGYRAADREAIRERMARRNGPRRTSSP